MKKGERQAVSGKKKCLHPEENLDFSGIFTFKREKPSFLAAFLLA
jgi:hypothetical protein